MKLRVRLFVYIAVLFSSVFLFAFFFQDYLVDYNLTKNQKDFEHQIERINEEKIKKIEAYISDVLSNYSTNINALLTIIRDYPILRFNFQSTGQEKEEKTWLDSSTLITNNKWIELVQNIKKGQIASTILLDNKTLHKIRIYKLSEHLNIVFLPSEDKKEIPVIAVKWDSPNFLNQEKTNSIYPLPEESIADFYVLFTKERIENFDFSTLKIRDLILTIDPLYPFLKWIKTDEKTKTLNTFIEELKLAQQEIPNYKSFFEKPNMQALELNEEEKKESILVSEDPKLDIAINRYHQIGLIWGFSWLIDAGPFGENPFDAQAPLGIIRAKKGYTLGEVLLRKEVFYERMSLQKNFQKKVDEKEYLNFGNKLEVLFFKDDKEKCCFGNTAYFMDDGNISELTIGVRAETVFKELALATNRDILFISDDQVISFFDSFGNRQPNVTFSKEEINHFLNNSVGEFTKDGIAYFFLHIQPFLGEGFHFYAITTKEQEFYLMDKLKVDVASIVHRINWQMASIAIASFLLLLIFLDAMARRIAKPISVLAQAARHVKEGNYDETYHPEEDKINKDEVTSLKEAFEEMVQGLKEKEKVRSILNKVVSTDIANEILKTELNLGGEEKEVTMFFSDIRSFTEKTENMSPTEVVSMLNECMTKISNLIEGYNGVIDKYIGDAVMAIFGAPLRLMDSEFQAVLCAIAIRDTLNKWNIQRQKENKIPITMGIGIHKGKVLVGNMGGANRLNYTVIGSSVNLASRICGGANEGEILISESVYLNAKLQEHIEVQKLEPRVFKGFSEKIPVYSVIGYKKTV